MGEALKSHIRMSYYKDKIDWLFELGREQKIKLPNLKKPEIGKTRKSSEVKPKIKENELTQ